MRAAAPRARRRAGATIAALLAFASGCSQRAPYEPSPIELPSSYLHAGRIAAGSSVLSADWWRNADDPQLERLVDAAMLANLDVSIAATRIREAEALREAASGARVPTLDGTASASLGSSGRSSGANALASWSLPLGAPADLAERAAAERVGAAQARAEAVRLVLLSDLLVAYTDLRHSHEMLEIVRARIGNLSRLAHRSSARSDVGLDSALSVDRAQARLHELRAVVPGIEASRDRTMLAIATLAGVYAGDMAGMLSEPPSGLRPDRSLPGIGLPAEMVRRRPDVNAREYELAAAMAEIGIAQSALLPQLRVNGDLAIGPTGGLASLWSLAPSVSIPILGRSALRSGVDARVARARQAQLEWQRSVRDAVGDVERAMVDIRRAGSTLASLDQAIRARRSARRRTAEAFELGVGDADEAIEAVDDLLEQEAARLTARRDLAHAWIDLHVGLGMGKPAIRRVASR